MTILPVKTVSVAVPFVGFPMKTIFQIGAQWKSEVKVEPALIQGKFHSRLDYLATHLKVIHKSYNNNRNGTTH